MKIRILNKNLDTVNDYDSSRIYEIDEAPVFTEAYNETLDSATIVISNQTEKIKLEPYDVVEILFNDGSLKKRMCIDTYTEKTECVNPKTYKYEITLFSETKQLEGIILPNLKITSLRDLDARSIFHYIDQYMSEYSPYIRIVNGNSYGYGNKWNWLWDSEDDNHPSLEDKFADDCPEMQWNTPTLREVLNDLMMVKDCIPIIKDGKLDYIDLTQINRDITEDSHINYVTRSKSSEDYISELQMKLENVTNNSKGSNNVVTKTEYVSLNIPDDDIVLTTNNMRLEVQYPIYNLKKVVMMFPGGIRGQSPSTYVPEKGWVSVDIMNFEWEGESVNLVYEKNEWITKNILYNTLYPKDLRKWPKYQNSTFYYTRGGREIENFNNTVKYLITTQALYQKLCQMICQKVWPNYDFSVDNYEGIYPEYYNLMFKVEYETLEGCVFRASKGTTSDNERVVIDNQTNSMVDSYAQGFLEYQKANRLGNEQLEINARFLPTETPIMIGDKYEDSIVYQCQYQYYNDHVEVNAIATKNYVLREYFTGVKSKIRSWKIVSGDEALVRHDLEKYYCEFSWGDHVESHGLGELSKSNIAFYLTSPVRNYDSSPLKCCFVRTVDDDVNPHPANMNIDNVESQKSYYCMDLMTRIVGSSLVFTFEFPDNYWAGQSIHTTNDYNGDVPTHGTGEDKEIYVERSDIEAGDHYVHGPDIKSRSITGGGVPMYQHRYTDDNGEFAALEAVFATNCKLVPTFHLIEENQELFINDIEPGQSWYSGGIAQETQYSIYYIYQRPRVFESNFRWSEDHEYDTSKFSIAWNHYKDSQEIINLSTQFEFCSDTTDICFGKSWLSRQESVNLSSNSNSNFKLLRYASSKYDFRNPSKLPDGTPTHRFTAKIGYNQVYGSNLNIRLFVALQDITFDNAYDANQAAEDSAKDACFYLNDGNESSDNVLLAFNNVPKLNATYAEISAGVYVPCFVIVMNILRTRNKNIYDSENHYLINRKL